MTLLNSLLSALVGGFIGTAGTIIAWRIQSREARLTRMEQYKREDVFRLHTEKIEAYSAFYRAAGHARRVLGYPPTDESAADVRSELWHAFTSVLLVGDDKVLEVANKILVHVTDAAFHSAVFDKSYYSTLIGQLQATARADISRSDLLSPSSPPDRHSRSDTGELS